MSSTRNYYTILGLQKRCSDEDIKKAFRALALAKHPDRNRGREEEAAAEFKDISNAHDILSDKQKRRYYDGHSDLRGDVDDSYKDPLPMPPQESDLSPDDERIYAQINAYLDEHPDYPLLGEIPEIRFVRNYLSEFKFLPRSKEYTINQFYKLITHQKLNFDLGKPDPLVFQILSQEVFINWLYQENNPLTVEDLLEEFLSTNGNTDPIKIRYDFKLRILAKVIGDNSILSVGDDSFAANVKRAVICLLAFVTFHSIQENINKINRAFENEYFKAYITHLHRYLIIPLQQKIVSLEMQKIQTARKKQSSYESSR